MTKFGRFIFYFLLAISLLSLWISVELGLIIMLLSWVSTLVILMLKKMSIEQHSKTIHWFAWSLHGMLLVAVYMAFYGVANIVGSGRNFSSRMAVSTLRTLHWAERQCIPKAKRLCTIGELKGEVVLEGLNTRLLRTDFKRVLDPQSGQEFGRLGQYNFMVKNWPKESTQSWVAYAWPATDPTLQSFCIDQNEEIMELPILTDRSSIYLGFTQAPQVDACLGALHTNPDPPLTTAQKEAIKAGKKPPPHTHLGADQQVWQRWRGRRTRISKSLSK